MQFYNSSNNNKKMMIFIVRKLQREDSEIEMALGVVVHSLRKKLHHQQDETICIYVHLENKWTKIDEEVGIGDSKMSWAMIT